MAGIYIHIPFCRQACHYCNFHFSTSLKLQNDFLDALLKEIRLRCDYTGGEDLNTIYFGGGTPSLMDETSLNSIMDTIHHYHRVSPGAEITLEANPDDITPQSLQAWRQTGINRLSIGVQSFADEDLAWMNRAHNAAQAENCIRLAQEAGISNLSIDLIYGTPGMSDRRWADNMHRAAALEVPHLSCYALTVEPGTALEVMIRKNTMNSVSNDDQAHQFLMMTDYFQDHGYEHYEISNLSLPGKRSIHNSAYWSGALYIGVGPSAHSFNGKSRQWNIANNALYIQSLKNERVPFEIEELNTAQRFNEYLMTGLRKSEGININTMRHHFGHELAEELLHGSKKFVERCWMEQEAVILRLTRQGKLFADHIASELFRV